MLADGQIRIADLEENRILVVEGAYVQLAGWSPSGAYLLAAQEDSQYTVIQAEGQVLYTTTGLPQPAFWAPPDALYEDEEMLALPQRDGSLAGLTFPSQKVRQVLPPGSLGADGMAVVRWGTGGNLIVTPSLEQIQQRISFAGGDLGGLEGNGPDAQNLATRGADGQFSGAGPVSMDSHQAYYQVLDGVPGGQSALVLAAEIRGGCSSCQTDGLPLVTLDAAWSMRAIPLGVDLLLTPEALAWNPAQAGLLALAIGGSRYTLENKRLALVDVPAGTLQIVTGAEQVVFEPSWSPEGRWLVYAALPAVEKSQGSADELERALGGRGLAVYDLLRGETRPLTLPGKGAIDGWPRWTADGKTLLHARKMIEENSTQVRALDLETGKDYLLFSLPGAPQACHRTACGWDQMLAYSAGSLPGTAPEALFAPSPTPSIQAGLPQAGWNTYRSSGYGFEFQFPAGWQLSESPQTPNWIRLARDTNFLMIGFRRPAQNVYITRTGVPAGDFVPGGTVTFLGQELKRSLLVYEDRLKAVLYQGGGEFEAGGLMFTLSLDDTQAGKYEDVQIPEEIQTEVDQILESFKAIE